MKQRKFKIKNSTLFVFKSIKSKTNFFFTETEPTTNATPTTSISTSTTFNR